MPVYSINPLDDPRWAELVDWHPRSSIFHTCGWLRCLRQTYGYEPVAFTTSKPGQQLTNGIVFCAVRSWITGSRLVSLPFSDHCEPLCEDPGELRDLLDGIGQLPSSRRWDYIELRPFNASGGSVLEASSFAPRNTFRLHTVDLHPEISDLFKACEKGSIQRKIQRAKREGVLYQDGCSEPLLKEFYRLLLLTRRRHHAPPQPLAWFRNLAQNLADAMKVRLASTGGGAVASIMTFCHKRTMVYKYGGSDLRYSNLGGTPLLFWRTIEEAKSLGCDTFDLGRSNVDNPGLIRFKDNWGASDTPLVYWRSPVTGEAANLTSEKRMAVAGRVASRLPDRLFAALGQAVYRHIG